MLQKALIKTQLSEDVFIASLTMSILTAVVAFPVCPASLPPRAESVSVSAPCSQTCFSPADSPVLSVFPQSPITTCLVV